MSYISLGCIEPAEVIVEDGSIYKTYLLEVRRLPQAGSHIQIRSEFPHQGTFLAGRLEDELANVLAPLMDVDGLCISSAEALDNHEWSDTEPLEVRLSLYTERNPAEAAELKNKLIELVPHYKPPVGEEYQPQSIQTETPLKISEPATAEHTRH
jgi:hypothetical protein